MRIDIKGTIVPDADKWAYDLLKIPAVCPREVLASLARAEREAADVYINSPGGEIFAGSEIYAALQAHSAGVRIHIVGQACSAASIIACAGHCDMVRTGMMMIHNVQSGARGDHNAMTHEAGVLCKADRAICAAYVAKTGRSESELLRLMERETWLTAQEALELGFIDAVAEPARLQLAASGGGLLSPEALDRLRALHPDGGRNAAIDARIRLFSMKIPSVL